MTLWKNLVVALVAAFALAACSSNDNGGSTSEETPPAATGPTQAELDAAKQAQADAEAEAEAEKKRADALQAEKDANAAAADIAKLNQLAAAIGPVLSTDVAPLTQHFTMATGHPSFGLTEGVTGGKKEDPPHTISGWNGASYREPVTGSKDMKVFNSYNNKGNLTTVEFAAWLNAAAGEEGDAVPIAEGQANEGYYTLAGASHGKYIKIDGMPTNPNHDALPVGSVNGVRGSLNEIPGRFKASPGASVEITVVGAKDVPTWDAGTLNFKPDSPTAMVMQEDQSYMTLGWWLTEKADGTLAVEVSAYGNPYSATSAGRGNALLGKATFAGIAVGKYTHKTVNSISGGHYNADATLMADFGDSEAGNLTGTINNFRQDGMSIDKNWSVKLDVADEDTDNIGSDFTVTAADNSAEGSFGGLTTVSGTWQARFVGDERMDVMPAGVVGEFHIGEQGDPINMVGAFAASNQEADQVERK